MHYFADRIFKVCHAYFIGLYFAVTCWDVGTAVEFGEVTFDRETLTEGTVATVTCDEGYTLVGNETFTCVGGWWNEDLPTCKLGCTVKQDHVCYTL